jgi:hypothetical protein
MVNWWDWLLAVVYLVVFGFLNFFMMELKWLGDRNSPYPFDQDEMERGGIAKRHELVRERKLELARR